MLENSCLIDSHIHLDFADFDSDRTKLLNQAKEQGICHWVVPATQAKHWPKVAGLASANCSIAIGLHPYFIDQHSNQDLALLEQAVIDSKAVAIGECGLDFYDKSLNEERQYEVLMPQLALAKKLDLPLILHSRKANDELYSALKKTGLSRGVVHSFSGSRVQADKFIQLGFKLGFGGAMTYPRALKIRALAKDLPLTSILIETDAPDQPPLEIARQRNVPAQLIQVFNVLCDLRHEAPEVICSQLSQSTIDLFSIKAYPCVHSEE